MKITFTSDGSEAPGPRYRCVQFFEYFAEHGIECDIYHAYGKLYNRVFDVPVLGSAYKVATRAKRAARTIAARNTDLLFHQRTAFPQSAFAERIARRRGIPSVFDFDDAIFLGPEGRASRFRERAFLNAVSLADHCIAGNRYLMDVAGVPEKTSLIPTVIDTDRYVPSAARVADDVVVGWMGTASNFTHLHELVPALRSVLEECPAARVRLVSNAEFEPLRGVPRVEQLRWSAAREIELLQSFDIGLMPLVDSPVARGKCAFKMIQYMAVGAPVVVSAVGANVEVMGETNAGFLLDSFDDWADALLEMVWNPDLRSRQGREGRQHAVEHYSVGAVLPEYLAIFTKVAATGC